MASAIDPTKPAYIASKGDLQANLLAAKTEIEALQFAALGALAAGDPIDMADAALTRADLVDYAETMQVLSGAAPEANFEAGNAAVLTLTANALLSISTQRVGRKA